MSAEVTIQYDDSTCCLYKYILRRNILEAYEMLYTEKGTALLYFRIWNFGQSAVIIKISHGWILQILNINIVGPRIQKEIVHLDTSSIHSMIGPAIQLTPTNAFLLWTVYNTRPYLFLFVTFTDSRLDRWSRTRSTTILITISVITIHDTNTYMEHIWLPGLRIGNGFQHRANYW